MFKPKYKLFFLLLLFFLYTVIACEKIGIGYLNINNYFIYLVSVCYFTFHVKRKKNRYSTTKPGKWFCKKKYYRFNYVIRHRLFRVFLPIGYFL